METAYLFQSPENAARLLAAIERAKARTFEVEHRFSNRKNPIFLVKRPIFVDCRDVALQRLYEIIGFFRPYIEY